MLHASSSHSVRSVKDLVKKLETKPSQTLTSRSVSVERLGVIPEQPKKKSKRRSRRHKSKVQASADVSDDSSISDFSTDSANSSSQGSQFAYSVGVQSIKDEIEERIRKSRETSNLINPTTFWKPKVNKSEMISAVYQKPKTHSKQQQRRPNSGDFENGSPLFDGDQRLVTLEAPKLIQQQQVHEEEENKTVVTTKTDNVSIQRTIFSQRAESVTQMYQTESVFGEESPFFIGEPIQEEDEDDEEEDETEEEEELSPNISERTDKDAHDCMSIAEKTEMSGITMNEQQFMEIYRAPQQARLQQQDNASTGSSRSSKSSSRSGSRSNSEKKSAITEESSSPSKVTTETFGSAVLKLLQDAITTSPSAGQGRKQSSSSVSNGSTENESNTSELLKEDQEDKERLRNFLREVGCTQSKANMYAQILVGNGVPNIDVLTRRITRDNYYLEKIGFDEFFARDIVELLTPDAPQQSSSPLPQQQSAFGFPSMNSFPSMPSMKSIQSLLGHEQSFFMTPSIANNNKDFENSSHLHKTVSFQDDMSEPSFMRDGPGLLPVSSQFKMDHLPSETSSIYYQAVQIGSVESAEKLIELAESGDLFAQGFIMRMKALGQGSFSKDFDKAKEIAKLIFPILKETVRSKLEDYSCYASYLVGVCYSEGLVCEKNAKEAIKWYKQSAKLGYDAAQAYVGYALYSGIGIVKNRVEAVKWYTMSASQGYAPAQTNLGICYEFGEGVSRDVAAAMKWYRLAADQNDPTAMYNIGHAFETGLGGVLDIAKAADYYTSAAELNHSAAQNSLAYLYSVGYPNFPQNLEESVRLYTLSAEQGHHEAQCRLGLMFENGIGVSVDTAEAVKYYRLSANQGNPAAMYYLGFCYFNGIGVEKDLQLAVKLYYKSAQKNYAAAQNNLGFCYFIGSGVKKSYVDSLRWYKKSAEQSYPAAQYNLGYCYEKGYGVPVKLQEMLKWYRLAAKGGHPKAIRKLQEWKEK